MMLTHLQAEFGLLEPEAPCYRNKPRMQRRELGETQGKLEAKMASEHVLTVTDENFDSEVIKSKEPVLLDFWAAWCGPCRAIGPVVEQLAKEYVGQVKVGKVNVDENRHTPTQYDVRSIPTLLLFKEGKVIGQVIGAVPRPKIEELLKKAL